MKNQVLVVATGRKTEGGITSVVKIYEKTRMWQEWNCFWIETHIEKSKFLKFIYFCKGLFIFLVKIRNASIVHIHLSEPISALRKSFFFYLACLFKKKTILHFHAFSIDTTIKGLFGFLYKNMFRKCDVLIVLSPYWKKEIQRALGEDSCRIEVLFNPCMPKDVQSVSILRKEKYILYAGILNKRKGYEVLLSAFSTIHHRYDDWKIVFAGSGESEKAKDLSLKLGIFDQILFTGWVSGAKKEELFNKSAFLCLPSYNEGFPMAVLDAWSFGLPVITTPVGGLSDILIHGENSLIFEPGDSVALALHMEHLINNEDLLLKLGRASFELSQGPFNIHGLSEKLSNIYESLS